MSFLNLKLFSNDTGYSKKPAVIQTDGAQIIPGAAAGIYSGEQLAPDPRLNDALLSHIEKRKKKNRTVAIILIAFGGLMLLCFMIPSIISILTFLTTGEFNGVSSGFGGTLTFAITGGLGAAIYISGLSNRKRAEKAISDGTVSFYRYIYIDKILHSYKDAEGDLQENYYAMLGEFSVTVEKETPKTKYAVGAVVFTEGKSLFFLLCDVPEISDYCK